MSAIPLESHSSLFDPLALQEAKNDLATRHLKALEIGDAALRNGSGCIVGFVRHSDSAFGGFAVRSETPQIVSILGFKDGKELDKPRPLVQSLLGFAYDPEMRTSDVPGIQKETVLGHILEQRKVPFTVEGDSLITTPYLDRS